MTFYGLYIYIYIFIYKLTINTMNVITYFGGYVVLVESGLHDKNVLQKIVSVVLYG
jgi:hypothetical protein